MKPAPESFPSRVRLTTEAVGDELQAPRADSFTMGKYNIGLVVATGNDGGFRRMNHQNVQMKANYKYPFMVHQLSVFSTLAINMVYKIARFQF
jgi:hypothetical protein